MTYPPEYKYTKEHEWLHVTDPTATVGITDHAQEALGDLVFVELPEPGRNLAAGEACAVVESVKAASDIYAPIAATVVAVNAQLAETPALINQDPYGRGWIMRLRPSAPEADSGLLSARDYQLLAAPG